MTMEFKLPDGSIAKITQVWTAPVLRFELSRTEFGGEEVDLEIFISEEGNNESKVIHFHMMMELPMARRMLEELKVLDLIGYLDKEI